MSQSNRSDLFKRVQSLVTGSPESTLSASEGISSLCDEVESLRTDLGWYREAYKKAEAHVARQEFAGKHEQDRIDAVEWLEKWGNRND